MNPREFKSERVLRRIAEELSEDAQIKLAMASESVDVVAEVARILVQSYQNGGKILLFGNGGSAADAQHIAGELVGQFLLHHRSAMSAIALTVNTSVLTAIGNDFGYDALFARQVEALADPQDVIIALSTSGNSANVLEGVHAARAKGATTIGLTGADGGALARSADLVLRVPSSSTQRIQEAHITIGHILCGLVEEALFGVPDSEETDAALSPSLAATTLSLDSIEESPRQVETRSSDA